MTEVPVSQLILAEAPKPKPGGATGRAAGVLAMPRHSNGYSLR